MFRIGSQCGLKPNEVLDMSLDMFNAYVKGYSDRLLDQEILAIQSGYWAGYYVKSKHPKSMKTIIENLLRRRSKQEKSNSIKSPAPDVDVEAFLEREKKFKEKMSR